MPRDAARLATVGVMQEGPSADDPNPRQPRVPAEPDLDELAWPDASTPLTREAIADLDEARKRKALRFLGGLFLSGVLLIALLVIVFG